ncbi:MAG TPA: YtxH domain-containing protein [Candidatus Saccharimonadales bacterium]|nr:YtxH domain-containing protein [Candidatus Saccharimonadales bacterium]
MKKESKWALGALIAAGAGYLAGILTAPRSGKRTRKKISSSASKARVDGEKQLKQLYSELQNLIKESETRVKKSKIKVDEEFKKQLENSKKTKQKVKMIISAIHSGEATDPDLKDMLEEAKKAKSNLSTFLKK